MMTDDERWVVPQEVRDFSEHYFWSSKDLNWLLTLLMKKTQSVESKEQGK